MKRDTVIPFPKRPRRPSVSSAKMSDPGIVVRAIDGRILDKMGMSGTECCYILLPEVETITLEYPAAAQDGGGPGEAFIKIEKVILSEADAVTEIAVSEEERAASEGGMRWIDPGKTLFLARQSPAHVALISLKLVFSHD